MGMLEGQVQFVIGVGTHRDTHTAAVCDPAGAVLMDATVATTTTGHRQLLGLAQRHASGRRVWAVEGTGSFGAGLTSLLVDHGELVVEVDRPKRPAARRTQRPDGLHDAVASFGRGGGRAGKDSPGGRFAVDRIRLVALAASTPIRPVDLHDVDPTVEQQPGQASTVAAGAFHPDRLRLPVTAQPAQQLPVTTTVSGELPVDQQPSLLVDDGSMVSAAVGVHAADDHPDAVAGALGHAGVAFPLEARARTGTHRSGGRMNRPGIPGGSDS